eukprot:scaffold68431_cov45-Phaeocystis_antarctica.AAC.1
MARVAVGCTRREEVAHGALVLGQLLWESDRAAPAGSVHHSPRSRRYRDPARATPGVRGGARVRSELGFGAR